MARPDLLEEQDLKIYLEQVPEWSRENNSIVREFVCSNFTSVIGLVNSIAILAEKFDHHPNIYIYGWNKLRVTLSTHDRGGLTTLDFDLAKEIETIKVNI